MGRTEHMTGYPTVAAKLTCAKAAGFLRNAATKRIAYIVPRNANEWAQKRALQVAMSLANASAGFVEVPRAYLHGQELGFCDLFDVSRISKHVVDATDRSCFIIIATEDDFFDWLQDVNFGADGSGRVCFDFDLLSEMQSDFAVSAQDSYVVPLCDPSNPEYKKIHCCERKDGSDEITPNS